MFCPNCSYDNPADVRYCRNCEVDLKPERYKAADSTFEHSVYAGIIFRLLAFFLDVLIFFLATTILVSVVIAYVALTGEDGILGQPEAASALGIATIFIFLVYTTLMEGSKLRGTLGKHWLNLAVHRLDGEPLGMMRSLLRLPARLLTLAMFPLMLFQPFSNDRQFIHDMLADSVVTFRNESQKISFLATAVVLLAAILIPLLIFLATAGRPMFVQQVQQAQLESGLKAGMAITAATTRFYRLNGRIPVSVEDVSLAYRSNHLSEISFNQQNGTVILGFSAASGKGIRGKHLVYTPFLAENQTLVWKCSSNEIESYLLPASCPGKR